MHLPFNKKVFDRSFLIACVAAILGWLVIYLIWGEYTTSDIIGMIVAVPILAYFIHMLYLINGRQS